MADSTAHLRRKIGSAADLQSVVRAMKAQAAASVGPYATSVAALVDYARTVELGLGACFRLQPSAAGAQPEPVAGNRSIRAVVFGSDQGLVGRFNDSVVEQACRTLPPEHGETQVWAVGDRVRASLVDAGLSPRHTFDVPASVQAITGLVSDILLTVVEATTASAAQNGLPELHLFHNRPTTAATYVAVGQQLLPLDETWRRDLARRPWPTALPPQLLGNPAEAVRDLIGEYLFVSIFRASAESLASENASRLAAMDRADRNIDKMLGALRDRFHRLRQSRIDEELSDVISGFKALTRHGG